VGVFALPFDVFDAQLELVRASKTTLTEFRASGLVAGSDCWGGDASQFRLGVFLTYGYQNRLQREFQDENIGLRLLSRKMLSPPLEVRTDVGVGVNPLSAVESDYPEEDRAAPSRQTSTGIPTIGRTYDYAPGGLAAASASSRRRPGPRRGRLSPAAGEIHQRDLAKYARAALFGGRTGSGRVQSRRRRRLGLGRTAGELRRASTGSAIGGGVARLSVPAAE
jgi:hypothetical protein